MNEVAGNRVPRDKRSKKIACPAPSGVGALGLISRANWAPSISCRCWPEAKRAGQPDARIERVQFQGDDEGYALDDLIVHGASDKGSSLLEN